MWLRSWRTTCSFFPAAATQSRSAHRLRLDPSSPRRESPSARTERLGARGTRPLLRDSTIDRDVHADLCRSFPTTQHKCSSKQLLVVVCRRCWRVRLGFGGARVEPRWRRLRAGKPARARHHLPGGRGTFLSRERHFGADCLSFC